MASWLQRLFLFQKFLILGAIALVLTAIPLGLYITDSVGGWRQAQREARGILPLMAVHQTVQQLQAHRGTAAGMLGGDATMAARRPAIGRAVQQHLEKAESALQAAQAPAALQQQWQQLQRQWQQLERAVDGRQLNAAQSMAQHTQLVGQSLQLGEQLMHVYALSITPQPDKQALMQALLVQAPLLGENLGLLRGQGTGYLAQGFIPLESRGTLRALQRRVTELQAAVHSAAERAVQANPVYQRLLGIAFEQTAQEVNQSLQLVQAQLLDAEVLQLEAPAFFDTLTQALTAMNALMVDGSQVLAQSLDAEVRAQQQQLVGVLLTMGAGLLLSIWLMVRFVRSITEPLNQAVALARAIAQGDLSGADVATGRNEVGTLLSAQQHMRRCLRPLVAQVRQGADGVALASQEIAQGNRDLSMRTESQASALEETAASMEELSATVRHNADSAHAASQLADRARDVAEQSGTVVAQVVDAMQDIHTRSEKIATITGVMDGIAFQTNILALNAAVEAARAGEQGRGFAVVAAEVRTLAQRSADAAQEIRQLIQASVQRVGEGHGLVQQAGSTMAEVVDAIHKVNDMVAAISSASQEQANGVAQVGAAIQQMDQATQQNAALVEEMAAAAQSLQRQGQELVQAVALFR